MTGFIATTRNHGKNQRDLILHLPAVLDLYVSRVCLDLEVDY